jgi:hypothetical protein
MSLFKRTFYNATTPIARKRGYYGVVLVSTSFDSHTRRDSTL